MIFNKIQLTRPKRNVFNLSHDKKTTLKMGELTPIFCEEVIPSDTFNISVAQVMRMAPMLAPIMHKVDVYTHFFFVPNRILWDNSADFYTGGEQGDANPAYPTINLKGFYDPGQNQIGTIADHLGIPEINVSELNGDARISALPFAAYGMIWNEYYRDQNLQAKLDIKLQDGDNTFLMRNAGLHKNPFKRAWRHDYFTSSLPFAQKGGEVTLPIGDHAPILYKPDQGNTLVTNENGDPLDRQPDHGLTQSAGILMDGRINEGDQFGVAKIDVSKNHVVDLSDAKATSINELRTAIRLQEWLERNARAGGRYSEFLKAHFGVQSSDARLQRPEYIGGSKSPIVISEVLQQSESAETPQGNMAGHGLNVNGSNSFKYYSEEHGWIIGIMSVVPRADYYQGIPRQFSKFDRYEHFYPTFAHLGEQEVKNKEIFVHKDESVREETFGYLPRYAEYRCSNNRISGEFKKTLEFWHMGRKFDNQPRLNEQFIMCDPTTRIFAVEDENWEQLYCMINFAVKAKRPLPYYGTPTI